MTNSFVRNVTRTFGLFAAAARAANATEARRTPRAQDLVTLGIDPAAFRDINR